jgi:L-asparagine oxygenase
MPLDDQPPGPDTVASSNELDPAQKKRLEDLLMKNRRAPEPQSVPPAPETAGPPTRRVDIRPVSSIVTVDPEDSAKLFKHFASLRRPEGHDVERFLTEALRGVVGVLPVDVLHALRVYKNDPMAGGAVLVRGLPGDRDLTRTPPFGDVAECKATFVSEAVLLGLAALLGEPYSFSDEKDGAIPHNIVGIRGDEDSQSNRGSGSFFKFHTELAWSELRPAFIGLLCLRCDPRNEGATLVSEARKAVNLLTPPQVEELRKPQFRTRISTSFRAARGDHHESEPHAILSGPTRMPGICVDSNQTYGLTPEANAALAALTAALEDPVAVSGAVLQPGDLLFVHNGKAVHGRTPFRLLAPGYDRWLQRTYVRGNLFPCRSRPRQSFRVI